MARAPRHRPWRLTRASVSVRMVVVKKVVRTQRRWFLPRRHQTRGNSGLPASPASKLDLARSGRAGASATDHSDEGDNARRPPAAEAEAAASRWPGILRFVCVFGFSSPPAATAAATAVASVPCARCAARVRAVYPCIPGHRSAHRAAAERAREACHLQRHQPACSAWSEGHWR